MTEERNALKGNQPMVEIIGVGGGGCNAVNFMMHSGIKDATFLVSDMDQSVLNQFPKQHTIQLGTDGLGAGNRPEKAKVESEKHIEKIRNMFAEGDQATFIVSSFGGGCGTGVAPVIAKAAKETGKITIGIITLPFSFEGNNKYEIAIDGVKELSQNVDAMFLLNNQFLLSTHKELSLIAAFKKGDELMCEVVKSIINTLHLRSNAKRESSIRRILRKLLSH